MSVLSEGGASFQLAPFNPPPWLRNPHLQTIAAELLPRRFGLAHAAWAESRREVLLELKDGDRLLAFLHLQPEDPEHQRPLVLHLHGMEGSANSNYQKGMSAKAFAAGFHSLRLNYRNCGDTEALARGIYHARQTEDVRQVLEMVQERWGFRRIYATGASLGANLLLRLLADGPPPMLQGAVAISPPIMLPTCSEALGKGFNRIYERYFLESFKRKLRRKYRLSPGGEELRPLVRKLSRIRSLRELDELVTAPLSGYGTVEAYYLAASTAGELDRIEIPTLLIHAQDDPFLPFSMYASQREAIARNPHLLAVFPEYGGHVGFLGRSEKRASWMDARWSENEAIAFLLDLEEGRV